MVFATILACALACAATAQKKPFEINTQTPEGALLQTAGQENDEAKKTALYEEFLQKYPKHDGVVMAAAALQGIYAKAGNADKAMQMGDLILAAEPTNATAGYAALQAAEQKKDDAAIKTWAVKTVDAAKKGLAVPKPADEDEAAEWAKEQDYLKQLIVRCEYSLATALMQSQDAKVKADLGDAMMQMNPESQYMPGAAPHYLYGLMQSGRGADAAAAAEKLLTIEKTNEDLMTVVADYSLPTKDFAKAGTYAALLVATVKNKPAPEGTEPAAWEKTKAAKMAQGYYIAGDAAYEQQKWNDADTNLRAALPLIQDNKDLLARVDFFLGFANHELARTAKSTVRAAMLADAKKFWNACAAIKGPLQSPCQKNLEGLQAGK
jgi:tetratricopeptide (TPR) repeat protein